MNNTEHLELVIKHFPRKLEKNHPLIVKLAQISELAKLEEQDIAELCECLSDEFDESFQRGIDASNRH